MGTDFLKGYAELAEGEKDPRNLLLAFTIDRVLLLEFDVKPHIEVSYPVGTRILGLPSHSNSTISPSAISQLLFDHPRMTHTALPQLTSSSLFGMSFLTPFDTAIL